MIEEEPGWSDALGIDIALSPIPAQQVITGSPMAGSVTLREDSLHEWGVWEITPGVSTDTEVREVFVVISGRGVLTRTTGSGVESVTLRPGVVVHLVEGEQTTWDIQQTLRKVYWAPQA